MSHKLKIYLQAICLFVFSSFLLAGQVFAKNESIVHVKKQLEGNYITVSADTINKSRKNSKKSLRQIDKSMHGKNKILKKTTKLQPEIASSVKPKVEVLQVNELIEQPPIVNTTEKFVFRNITNRRNTTNISNIEARTSKINYLRRQLQSR